MKRLRRLWELLRRLWELLSAHRHYFGIPHENEDGVLVMTCYGCSTDRKCGVALQRIGKK